MARFLNVAAGITLAATGEAAEMMRRSPAYRELDAGDGENAPESANKAPATAGKGKPQAAKRGAKNAK